MEYSNEFLFWLYWTLPIELFYYYGEIIYPSTLFYLWLEWNDDSLQFDSFWLPFQEFTTDELALFSCIFDDGLDYRILDYLEGIEWIEPECLLYCDLLCYPNLNLAISLWITRSPPWILFIIVFFWFKRLVLSISCGIISFWMWYTWKLWLS